MSCNRIEQVHAYYDGELALSQRGEFDAHLNECAECRDLLSDLRRVSDLLAAAPLADLPPAAMTRFGQTWFAAAQDRGVMRIAGWLTSAAAAILIGALLVRPTSRGGEDGGLTSAFNPTLQAVAMTPPPDTRIADNDSADLVDAAQWMVNDLTPDAPR
jgi:anti-sigma factor RsiW